MFPMRELFVNKLKNPVPEGSLKTGWRKNFEEEKAPSLWIDVAKKVLCGPAGITAV